MSFGKIEYLKNSKLVLGLSILLIAIFTAGLISKEANRTVEVWATKSNLAPGMRLSDQDLIKVSVLLPESSKNYISGQAQILGALVVNQVNVGDLIPVSSIAAAPNSLNQRQVPITTEITDSPINLQRGDVVDIYAVPTRDSKITTEAQLIGQSISLSEVLKENNSGKVSVVAIFSDDQVLPILQIMSDTRVIIVRSV
jgi:hypothetical protein